jgi:hypothetical protein
MKNNPKLTEVKDILVLLEDYASTSQQPLSVAEGKTEPSAKSVRR